jgi:hypothetical protein
MEKQQPNRAERRGMAKGKQAEMKGLGKRDAVGRAAKKFLGAREGVTSAKEALEDASATLVKLMREKRRQEIKIEGVIVSLRHIESQDMLKVRRPKQ